MPGAAPVRPTLVAVIGPAIPLLAVFNLCSSVSLSRLDLEISYIKSTQTIKFQQKKNFLTLLNLANFHKINGLEKFMLEKVTKYHKNK